MSASEVLQRAARLLTPPEAWTQGAIWRDSAGRALEHQALRARGAAHSWSLLGAVLEASPFPPVPGDDQGEAIELVRDATGAPSISAWNNVPGRTHAEVLAVLAAALRRANSFAERSGAASRVEGSW